LQRYRERGWEIGRALPWSEDEAKTNKSIRRERSIGDRSSWMIPFNNSGVDKPDIPDHVIEYAMFRMARSHYAPINLVVLEGMSADDIYYHYAITSIAFKACTLRYTYLFDTLNLVEWFRVRLNRLTFLEMSKLPEYKQHRSGTKFGIVTLVFCTNTNTCSKG